MSEPILPPDYTALLAAVKERIRAAQYEALRAVNRELVALYWDIGRLIADRQEENGRGTAVVERLAADLRAEFPGVSGFSARNLWYMRDLYRVMPPTRNCNHWLQKSRRRIFATASPQQCDHAASQRRSLGPPSHHDPFAGFKLARFGPQTQFSHQWCENW